MTSIQEAILLTPEEQAAKKKLRELAAFHGPRLQRRLDLCTHSYIRRNHHRYH